MKDTPSVKNHVFGNLGFSRAYVARCDWISLNSLGFIKIRLFVSTCNVFPAIKILFLEHFVYFILFSCYLNSSSWRIEYVRKYNRNLIIKYFCKSSCFDYMNKHYCGYIENFNFVPDKKEE